MTNPMQVLAQRLQYAVKLNTLNRLAVTLAAGAPCPLRVTRHAAGAPFRVTFYSLPYLFPFASVLVDCNKLAFGLRWRNTLGRDLWPLTEEELDSWITARLETPIPDDLSRHLKLNETLQALKDQSAEEASVHPDSLEKYHRLREYPFKQ